MKHNGLTSLDEIIQTLTTAAIQAYGPSRALTLKAKLGEFAEHLAELQRFDLDVQNEP